MDGSFELLKLPSELQAMIFVKVETQGLLQLSATCKTLHNTINDPRQDERLWKHKLPQCCNQYSLSLPFSNWLALPHSDEGGERPKGMTIGKQTITSYKDLACEVGKCVHSCHIDESKQEDLQAQDWMDVAVAKWNTGPSLDKFVKYSLLILLELLSLERAAMMLKHAVDFIHDHCILGLLLEGPAAWDSLTRANSDTMSVADTNTLATRQIATLIVLMTQIYRFSQPRLQELVERDKASSFKLQPLPDVFESLLSSHEEQMDGLASGAGRTGELPDFDEYARDASVTSFNGESVTHAEGSDAKSFSPTPDPADTKPRYQPPDLTEKKSRYQPLPTQTLKFVFLGGAYRSDDLIKAMQLLGTVGQEQELCAYSLTPLDAYMHIDISAISKMLAPGVSDVVTHIFTQPADFHKEFTAIHTWQTVARKQAAAAYEVLSPPYMCNRSSVWLAVSSYLTAFFLMRSKTRHQAVLSHMEVPGANSENVLVGCLIELTMELYSLGFLFAACNTSLLSILQNEVSSNPQEARYELVGQFVDVNVTLLEHNHSHSLKGCQSILRDCVCWALALFRLGEPPMYYHLNPFVVQRLSKVLFCCMLRLPSSQQQQRAAKAAMSLCRLCLQRMCHSIGAQPRELPLPEVNSRSRTKGPGLLHTDSGSTKASPAPHSFTTASDSTSTVPATSPAPGKDSMNSIPPLFPQTASGPDTASATRDAVDHDATTVSVADNEERARHRDCVVSAQDDAGAHVEASHPGQQKLWPSSLPDALSTDEQGCDSMRWLREWLAYGHSSSLDEFLEKQNVSDILGAPIVVPAGPNVKKPKSKWSWRWFLTGNAVDQSDKAATGSQKRPFTTESRPEVTWLGELQNVSREIEHNQTWEDYDAELTSILGIEGGADEIFALMPPENVGHNEFGCPWQTISRLYELLAQVCAALGINSVSALFYSLSVQSVMHLSPSHVLEDQLDPLQPGTAPLTVSRYLSSTLNHLATELITAADYPAALRALVFSRKVCAHELQTLQGDTDAATTVAMGGQNGRPGFHTDSNEARALLTYATAQLAATILELRSRYGIQQYSVEGPVWPQKKNSGWGEGEQNHRGPHDPPHMEVTTVDISYENMQSLTREAVGVARQCHVDSCLQALFVLGDMALVTYDLPEAQRILSIVALTAADGQVQHYNLVSQSQSFSAIASLSLGDAYSCKHTTTRCMSMFAFDSRNPMHTYSAEDDTTQIAFAAALDGVFGRVDVAPAEGLLSKAGGCEKQAGGVSEAPTTLAAAGTAAGAAAAAVGAATCGSIPGSQGADLHTGASSATIGPHSARRADSQAEDDTSGTEMGNRCSASWDAAQDLASDVAGPSGTSNAAAGGAVDGGSGGAGERGVAQYEIVSPQSLVSQGTEDLMLRLMCQTLIKGLPHQQLVDSLQMRALALHMQDCPADEEESRMEVFRNQIQEHGHPLTFRQAVVAACMDMKELLTLESTKEWLQVQMGQAQVLDIIDYLHAQNPDQPVPMPILTMQLAALGLVQRQGNEQEPQVVPHAAAVWEMIAIAEKSGLVPDSETLSRFMSPTIPGFQIEAPDASESRLDLLKNAASRSLDHVGSLLSLQHGVDCELQELSAIAFFMHQISLQVHIMYRNLPAARWALSLLTARQHDDASHVHTWYWAAAVANHCREWRRAGKLFTQAARCTLEYPHMAMRTKALVGVCEAILADVVSRSLWDIMKQRSEEFPHGRLEFLKKVINYALKDTEAAHDPGAELRALLITRVILEIEGLVTFSPQQGVLIWDGTARPAWCLGSAGLSPRKARFSQRMAHMQRNCFVTRTLLGCTVVVDPDATWRMACLLRA